MKTSTADFRRFEAHARRYLRDLGLSDWHVAFCHEPLDGQFSCISFNFASRKATIGLSTDFASWKPTDTALRRSALHEVLHLVLADLSAFAESAVSRVRVDEAEHAVIHRLSCALTSKGAKGNREQ